MTKSKALIVVAHADDEVLGMGGTIAKYKEKVAFQLVVMSESASIQFPEKPDMIKVKAEQTQKVADFLGLEKVHWGEFKDQHLDQIPLPKLIDFLLPILENFQPQDIYTHGPYDLNQDHRRVYEAVRIAARPYSYGFIHRFMTFPVDPLPLENNHQSFWNFFEDISTTLSQKIEAMKIYSTEIRAYPHPRSLEQIKRLAHAFGAMVGREACEVFHGVIEIR